MKILLVNKYLFPMGGAEEYMFSVGNELQKQGNEVQFFGTNSGKPIVGNEWNIFAQSYETSKILKANFNSLIYSKKAYKSLEKLIFLFQPDIIHLNNINFQLTPSIIYCAKKYNIPVVWTLHDSQLVCPNHRLFDSKKHEICTDCLGGNFKFCIKNKCIHESVLQSLIAYLEAKKYHKTNSIYKYVSLFISPSRFLTNIMTPFLGKEKITTITNFSSFPKQFSSTKKNYLLYFGRLSSEKGILTLINALPSNVNLVIAGSGPLEPFISEISKTSSNIDFVGFKKGKELSDLISTAKATVYPSEWYENCPLSIIESLSCGTPVIGSNLGGIPELIDDYKNGILFSPGNVKDLKKTIELYMDNQELQNTMFQNLKAYSNITKEQYCSSLINMYSKLIEENQKNAKTYK